MSKWRTFNNPMLGYMVGRVIDDNEPIHSGNIEYYGDYIGETKTEAQEVADRLNKEAR